MRRFGHLMQPIESAMRRFGHLMRPLEFLKERARATEPLLTREIGKSDEGGSTKPQFGHGEKPATMEKFLLFSSPTNITGETDQSRASCTSRPAQC
jgi:hypothetical protein